jgi:DNA-binding transcriptional regulator YiaG
VIQIGDIMTKKIKELIESYEYNELGFPIILKDVAVIQDRDYEYAQINHKSVMNAAAFHLVVRHENLDGARLHFLRRFIGYSLDQLADLISIPKSTLHNWEKEIGKPIDIPDEKLKLLFTKIRNILADQISSRLDRAIVKEIINKKTITPLEISDSDILL